jgi:hypothetical protein
MLSLPKLSCRAVSLLVVLLSLQSIQSAAQTASSDDVLLDATRYDVLSGRYSPFAKFQARLQGVLDACGKAATVVVPAGEQPNGKIDERTRQGIQAALGCEALKSIPAGSPAKDGVITRGIWQAVMPGEPAPSLRDRVDALVLSFEGTDFAETPEWNLCADNPQNQSDPKKPGFVCHNVSDPCSLLTWGPRGATAGSGREIQWILWLTMRQDPALVENAFGSELERLRRFLRLSGSEESTTCAEPTPLKRFMCAVWVDPKRRDAWDKAFVTLGRSPLVRRNYAQLYTYDEFDGGKLTALAALWKELGLAVSEVDYAFFVDRATHLGGPPEDMASTVTKMTACLDQQSQALNRNGAARRCLAKVQPHDTQPEYRLARDVAFYLDAFPDTGLSKAEVSAWANYVPLSATRDFGLSDDRQVEVTEAPSLTDRWPDGPSPSSSELTPEELRACPATVLSPVRRKTSR